MDNNFEELFKEALAARNEKILVDQSETRFKRSREDQIKREIERFNNQAMKRAKQAQLQGAMIAAMIAIAIIAAALLWFDELLGINSAGLSNTVTILGLVIALLGASSLIVYFYLRGWVTKIPTNATEHSEKTKDKDSELNSLRERVEALELAPPPSSDAQPLSASEVAEKLLPQVSVVISQLFEERYERKSAEHLAASANALRFAGAITRLEHEIKELGRKGSVNLSIGLFTTGVAIITLIFMVSQVKAPLDSIPKVLAHYLPWLSVTIFIEVFSFFFLRLYKATLDESRRYNDDLTRLTLQWVATDTGRFSAEPTAMSTLAKDLIDVSKPPKLASAEASRPAIDTDKALKTLLDALSKQLDTKTKNPAKSDATKSDEDD